MNGFEVLTALKQDPATRAIPIVLLTASEELCNIQRGFALSTDDCLATPFGAHDLLARVRKLLKHKISPKSA
jgi:CheY-like chemotaxis protein